MCKTSSEPGVACLIPPVLVLPSRRYIISFCRRPNSGGGKGDIESDRPVPDKPTISHQRRRLPEELGMQTAARPSCAAMVNFRAQVCALYLLQ